MFRHVLYSATVIGLILFCLILQIKYYNINIAILFCFGLTFFILWRLLHPISEISKEYKSEKIQKKKEYNFKFYDKYFTINDGNNIFNIKYFKLYKIFETNDFFYFYIDKNHAFLIDKKTFKNNATSSFSSFIQKKCWWKFVTAHNQ